MILLTGGTGTLGSRVLERLVANQFPLRVFTRGTSDWQDVSVPAIRQMGADAFLGDLRDPQKVRKALEGCTTVVHLAGSMRYSPQQDFHEIHVEALAKLVQEAQRQGVQRFIHVSCLAASPDSDSDYFRSKAAGEDLIVAGQFLWTIFRPSFMFGQRFPFLDEYMRVVGKLPLLPVIGGGLNEIQPVSVDDVAACIVQSVFDQDTAYKIYDLVGPKVYSQSELLHMVNESLPKPKLMFSVTSEKCFQLANWISKFFPHSPYRDELIYLLMSDSTGNPEMMKQTFPVRMIYLEDNLHRLVNRD